MKKIRKMDSTGDSVIDFNPAEAEAAATKEAKALFERIGKEGGSVFALDDKGDAAGRVTNFDNLAEDNVVVPRIVGG